jgi:hypothetical protein
VLAFPYVVHFFAHKFASLRTGGFAFASVFTSAFQGLFFGHGRPPYRNRNPVQASESIQDFL